MNQNILNDDNCNNEQQSCIATTAATAIGGISSNHETSNLNNEYSNENKNDNNKDHKNKNKNNYHTFTEIEMMSSTMEFDEKTIRNNAQHNRLYLLTMNTYAAGAIFVTHLVSYEGIISMALSVYLTIYIYNNLLDLYDNNHSLIIESFNGDAMNWILLTFVVVTPITSAAAMAFRRREQALQYMMILRSCVTQLYAAHSTWDFEYKRDTNGIRTSGRQRSSIDWLQHSDECYKELVCICDELNRFLTLPSSSRARHRTTRTGRLEALELENVSDRFKVSIMKRMGKLTVLCEVLKTEGLPGNESSRIRQWERAIVSSVESLHAIKTYRTPQGLRSFARLFSMFLPPFYAPYYASLAVELNSLGVAIAFACITAISLTSLFETVSQMEDPFEDSSHCTVFAGNIDAIDVKKELITYVHMFLKALRKEFFPQATSDVDLTKI